MEIREFAEKVCAGTAEKLGPEYEVRVRERLKNNGVRLQGISIGKLGEKTVPLLYLEGLWGEYQKGRDMEDIINEVLERHADSLTMKPLDVERFDDFEYIKGRICFRLFGREHNGDFLKGVPYVEFLDMAVCFYYVAEADQGGVDKLLAVNNALMGLWGTDTDELFLLAAENTPRILPEVCQTLEQLITKMVWLDMGGKEDELPCHSFDGYPTRVLSNARRKYGAACILYPGLLERIAEKEQGSFYIIPSSVHETILVKDTGAESADKLKGMVYEVNREVLEPEDVLTDSLYYYDAAEKRIKIAVC